MAITIDGGGIKGLIAAQALITLEQSLGCKPLINCPNLKVLAGTSTGAIVAVGIALGLSASEIVDIYVSAGRDVFKAVLPDWVPEKIQLIAAGLVGISRSYVYPVEPFRNLLRSTIARTTSNPDLTLGELGERLRRDQVLLIAVTDVDQQTTRFLSTDNTVDANWKVWEAILATTSAPTIFPVFEHEGHCYVDGGLGAYANPACLAALKLVGSGRYLPEEFSLFSLGTGYVDAAGFKATRGLPDKWNVFNWAEYASLVLTHSQTLAVVANFVDAQTPIDFRRYQIRLEREFAPFGLKARDLADMQAAGNKLGERIANDHHALSSDDGADPENMRVALVQHIEAEPNG